MTTQCTDALAAQLAAVEKTAPHEFPQAFAKWKAGGAAAEYSSYLFGKDGGYGVLPTSTPTAKLKHVHLVPLQDLTALVAWDRAWSRKSRKVSDRALVYAEDRSGNYLLLYILDEPDAHTIAQMRTPEHKQLMHQLAVVAETWAFSGKIDA